MRMELRMGSWMAAVLFIIMCQSAESFFFPQFLRRQSSTSGRNGPQPRPPPPLFPVKGQVLGRGDDSASHQSFHRPRAINNALTEGMGDPNFQVPQSLCLACGNFPWTPVAGKELGNGHTSSSTGVQQPITVEKPDNSKPISTGQDSQTFTFNQNDYPVHQHLQVTKEPGNTVVINALSSPDEPTGSRKPYAFSFASSTNSLTSQKVTAQDQGQIQGQNSHTFAGPIVIPYEQGKSPIGDTARQPAASSLTPGYAQPPPVPSNQRPPPGLYGSNAPNFNSPHAHFGPNLPRDHPHNLGPITVGTILAAQQSYQIQPAKLVYQEHTAVHQPQYFVPLPPRPPSSHMQPPSSAYGHAQTSSPGYAHAPSASSPQSFKLPILSSPGPAGTLTLNPVPLHSVPNYSPPKFIPNYMPQGVYAFPVSPPQQTTNQIHYFQPAQMPALISGQRQPKPGYPQFGEAFESNRFRVPEQQIPEQGVTYQVDADTQVDFKGPPAGYILETYGDAGTLSQKPLPPGRPYAPPIPTPSQSVPQQQTITFQHTDKDVPPSPTYIPPRVNGQLFTTFAQEPKPTIQNQHQTQNNNDISEEPVKSVDESGPQVTIEYTQSENSQFVPTPAVTFEGSHGQEEPIKEYSFSEASNIDNYRHKPITIPNLLKIQQGYRFLDEGSQFASKGSDYRTRYAIPQGQKGVIQGDELGQASILTQSQTKAQAQIQDEPPRKEEPIVSATVSSTSSQPIEVPVTESAYFPPTVVPPFQNSDRFSPDPRNSDKDSKKAGKVGYEVVPATQYDITHLFRGQSQGQGDRFTEEKQQAPKRYPVPVPVPISEADVANSKSPLFVIDPLSRDNQERNQDTNRGVNGNGNSGIQYHTHYGVTQHQPTYEEKQQLYANFHRQMYYDPLPPAVVSALQHAQSTSLLTHQHHHVLNSGGESPPKENTIYVNSVPVSDDDENRYFSPVPPPHNKRILKPIAFDLNSGKQIELQSSRNAEIISLQTVLDADAAEVEQRKTIPVYTLQQESNLRPIFEKSSNFDNQGSSADQNSVNCQNTPQWTVAPETRTNNDQEPNLEQNLDGGQGSPVYAHTHSGSTEPHGQKQFLVYYPSQPGGSYYINQQQQFPASVPAFDQIDDEQPSKGLVYGQEFQKEVEVITSTQAPTVEPDPQGQGQVPLDSKESISSKTYLAKPVLKWSKIVKPKVKIEESVTFSDTKESKEEDSAKAEPVSVKYDVIEERPQSSLATDDKVESESKAVVESTRTQTSRSSDGANKNSAGFETVVVGPTTVVECITESTTNNPTESYDTTIFTTMSPATATPTFSPRIHPRGPEDVGRNRTRFPSGRPTVSTIRRTTEETSSVSASVNVPVYKPPHNSMASILKQTLKTYNSMNFKPHEVDSKIPEVMTYGSVEDLSGGSSTETLAPSPAYGFSQSMSSSIMEDDEADEIQSENSLGEIATGRKMATSGGNLALNLNFEVENKTTTTPRLVFSSQIIPTSLPTAPGRSTKVVKTVRVRQRMRPANMSGYFSNLAQQRLKMNTGSSRVRVMTRAGAADYVRTHSEAAIPEGESLGEEEQKEVKEALIDIKRVSNS